MKAMVLAAGVGSRLRPLTDSVPKALVEVGGAPMLELVLRRLIRAGVDAAVVNAFHFPERIEGFLAAKGNFGIRIRVSREEELLDTGGGLQRVADFFDDGRPFFLHNVDVFSRVDLERMYRFHQERSALATLAVRSREGSGRGLWFDARGLLAGWESGREGAGRRAGTPAERTERLAFDGIHVISPDIFHALKETGPFPILEAYLRLAGEGERIQAFRSDEYFWKDVGGLEKLEELRRRVREGGFEA